jgi:CRP/FNR family nitrogen fixation transcriptional regulator
MSMQALSTNRTTAARALPASALQPIESEMFGPLKTVGTTVTVARGSELFAEGDDADALYQVRSGVLRLCKMLPDGRRQIEQFVLPGDLVGFEAGILHNATAEAVTDCVVIRYRRSRVETIAATDPRLARNILGLAIKQLSDAQRRLVLLGRNTAMERLAFFILEMMERTDTAKCVNLPMPRPDIADYLGLTTETVSRLFTTLRQDGVVALPSANRLLVQDLAALEALAEGDDGL